MATRKVTKRGNGEGSWKHLENNKWKVTITVGVNIEGKQIRRSKTGTKQECQKWLKEHQIATCSDYFYDYSMKWLKLREPEIASATYLSYITRISAISRINNFKINKANDFAMKEITEELLKTRKPQSVNYYLDVISQVLRYALNKGHIRSLPYIPKAKECILPKSIPILSPAKIKEVLTIAKFYSKGNIYPILLLAFATGMRIGELLALTMEDIDLDNNTICINKILSQDKEFAPYIKQGSKTKASNRTIYVNKKILEEAIKYCNKKQKYIFIEGIRGVGLNYLSKYSKLISYFFQKCGLRLTAHKIRHNFITLTQEQGISLPFVSSYVGHTLNSTTLAVYTHFAIDKPNKQLDNYVSLFFD